MGHTRQGEEVEMFAFWECHKRGGQGDDKFSFLPHGGNGERKKAKKKMGCPRFRGET